ncbi:MAG TPA: Clp protease N-terminal domain-containing protein, partial [Candidatus Limnocylindria bacterium]|nr:Clp protease N-terminal domain-containing protein [Candidatus Limnocylindria bacterium]
SKARTSVEFIIGRGDSTTSPSEITLTPRTKKIIELAIDESRKLGHSAVGTEHLLLGLVREGGSVATGILESVGISCEKVRHQVLAAIGREAPGTEPAPSAPIDRLDDVSRRIVALAQNEAVGLLHNWVGTEHLVLGLISANGTIAQRALNEIGVTLEAARERVAKAPAPSAEWQLGILALTPRLQRVLQISRVVGGPITPERMLHSLVADPGSMGAQVLKDLGATAEKVREAVARLSPPDPKC